MSSVEADMYFCTPEEMSPSIEIDLSGNKSYKGGYRFEKVQIHDGRKDNVKATLDTHGFELFNVPTTFKSFQDGEAVKKEYYPEIEALIKKVTGASRVLIFDHTVRREEANSNRSPVRHVHIDYTEESGPARLKDLITEPKELEQVLNKRFLQVNVWRSIAGTVERSPLAFMEALSVDPKMLVSTKIVFHGTDHEQGVVYSLKNDPQKQRWVYFSSMSQDEVVLLKGYDTKKDVARFTPHSAFDDPTSKSNAKPRASIEVRTFALFD